MKKLFCLIVMAILFTGCSDKGLGLYYPSACDSIEGPSMLCEMAAKNNINLTMLADSFGVLNEVAINKNKYSKADALKVLTELRDFLEAPVSYVAFKAELEPVLESSPYLVSATNKYISQLISGQIMYKKDQDLIKGWLDRMIAGLE